MAETTRTFFQNKFVFSVPRKYFLEEIVENDNLSKKEIRVFMLLMCYLNGYRPPKTKMRLDEYDPLNFTEINKAEMARTLRISKKDVSDAINFFVDINILEKGKNKSNRKGYRFTF